MTARKLPALISVDTAATVAGELLSAYGVRQLCAKNPDLTIPRLNNRAQFRIKTAVFLKDCLGFTDEQARAMIDVSIPPAGHARAAS